MERMDTLEEIAFELAVWARKEGSIARGWRLGEDPEVLECIEKYNAREYERCKKAALELLRK